MPIKAALNGLNAAQLGLRTTAHNIANAGTAGYRESRADSPVSRSTGPDAASSGATNASSVDLARQLIDMMDYSRQVEMQLKAIQTASEIDEAAMEMLDERGDAR